MKLDQAAGSYYVNHQQLDSANDPSGTATVGSDPWNAAHANVVAMIPPTANTFTGDTTIGPLGCPAAADPCHPAGTYGDASGVHYTAGMNWTIKGTSPQGQIRIVLERADGTYFVKSNSITSAAFSNPGANKVNRDVIVYTKASVYKLTASGQTSIDGNVTLRMDAHEGGQAGDTVGFTVLSSKTGALCYSNNWVYDTSKLAWATVMQTVGPGTAVVIN